MATTTKTKLLGGNGKEPVEDFELATTSLKLGLLLYLVAWIAAAAIGGFWYADHVEAICPQTMDACRPDASAPSMAAAPAGDAASAAPPPGATMPPANTEGQRSGKGVVLDEPRRLTDRQLFTFVVLFGIMGGALHGMSSLAAHAGRGRLYKNWWPFYLARPVVGAATAAVIYLILRGGLGGLQITGGRSGEFAAMGWAALAGLFSSVAMQKFRDVFEALFKPNQDGGTSGGAAKPPTGGPASPLPPAEVQRPEKETAPAPVAASPGGDAP